jgi:hypothetical protein
VTAQPFGSLNDEQHRALLALAHAFDTQGEDWSISLDGLMLTDEGAARAHTITILPRRAGTTTITTAVRLQTATGYALFEASAEPT